jgi:hypothetical protein
MAEQTQDKGFTIPPPSTEKATPQKPAPQSPAPSPAPSPMPSPGPGKTNSELNVILPKPGPDKIQSRDYLIAGGVLLVLFIAFFFAKTAYSNHLARKRVSPGAANAAGWWLFIFLSGLATAAVLSILSPVKFLTPIFMGPLLLVSLVAIVLMFVSGRRA